MSFRHTLVAVVSFLLLSGLAAFASPLVTGNGFGFAVVSPENATLRKFYAHPYSFARPDPKDPLSEGIETTNFIKTLRWSTADAREVSVEYLRDSQLIEAKTGADEGLFFMPFGLQLSALVIDWEPSSSGPKGQWEVEWSHPVKSQRAIRVLGSDGYLLEFDGVEESLLLIPLGTAERAQGDSKQVLSASRSWALVSIENKKDLEPSVQAIRQWKGGRTLKQLAERELAEIETWRVTPTAKFASDNERHLWRQSEILLRVAQSREPNRADRYSNGMIVACLPDGAFSNTWARDMAYATMALIRMGHRKEARAALMAYFNARPTGKMKHETGGVDYQVSVVRYFGDGAEEPFFTNEGATNIEYDDWGLVLWVLGEYVKRYDDPALLNERTYRGKLYNSARDYVVKPLVAKFENVGDGLIVAADTSIWEEHQKDKKHFAFSTAMAIVGLQEFAEVARRNRDERTCTELLAKIALLQKGFKAAFARDSKLHGTLEEGEKNDIDGALLAVINLGVVSDPELVRSTVERMEFLKVVSGGYKRVRSNYTDPAIYEYWYERQEFVFVDLSWAEVNRKLGHQELAASMLKRIVDKAAEDHNFVPEMYVSLDCKLFHGAIGDPTGAIPMVGYGAGAYILNIMQRTEMQNESSSQKPAA